MFDKIKNDILGGDYSLSIAYISKAQARAINKKYRGKDKPTNILSFPFSTSEGEMLLCKDLIKEEVKNKEEKVEGRNYAEWLRFLVIHGLLHLKGYVHSSKMERAEEHFSSLYDKKHFNRNRRGVSDDASSRRRVPKRRNNS